PLDRRGDPARRPHRGDDGTAGPHQGNDRAAVRPPARCRGSARRSTLCRAARPYLARAAECSACSRGRMTVGVENRALAPAVADDADRTRARAIAAQRRRRRTLAVLLIRVVSIAAVLAAWQWFGAGINPALFTTPAAVARAAVVMIGSGELWNYLWP